MAIKGKVLRTSPDLACLRCDQWTLLEMVPAKRIDHIKFSADSLPGLPAVGSINLSPRLLESAMRYAARRSWL